MRGGQLWGSAPVTRGYGHLVTVRDEVGEDLRQRQRHARRPRSLPLLTVWSLPQWRQAGLSARRSRPMVTSRPQYSTPHRGRELPPVTTAVPLPGRRVEGVGR